MARCAAVRVAGVVELVTEEALDALLLDDPPPRVRAKAATAATSTTTAMIAIVRDDPGSGRPGVEEYGSGASDRWSSESSGSTGGGGGGGAPAGSGAWNGSDVAAGVSNCGVG